MMMNNLLTNPEFQFNPYPADTTIGKQDLILKIMQDMSEYLNQRQLTELNKVLLDHLKNVELLEQELVYEEDYEKENNRLLEAFLDGKKLDGCTEKTLTFYEEELKRIIPAIDKPIREIRTEDLRTYLRKYQETGVSNVTLDNVRRILSSFFRYLHDEEYIFKNPMVRIHRIRAPKTIKKPFTPYDLERLRLGCKNLRERALMELLLSTGMRINECRLLNKDDINFHDREVIVFGKGSKERVCFFNESTEIHLKRYLESRVDDNPALFVSSMKNKSGGYSRLTTSTLGTMMKRLGERVGVSNCHPHRFRRTFATHALQHGMRVEQIQKLLGHCSMNTTELYISVDDDEVKYAHKKYVTS